MKTLVSLRNLMLIAVSAIVLAAIPSSEQLQFDQRIEAFFAPDNADLQFLEQSRRDFGGSEYVVVAWTEKRLFTMPDDEQFPQSLAEALQVDVLHAVDEPVAVKIRQITEQLHQIPGVKAEKTQHLADLLDAAPKYKPSRRSMLRLFEGTLVGRDGRTTGILLELRPEAESTESRGDSLSRIRAIAASMGAEVAVAGEPVQVYDMFRLVEQDGQMLFLVSMAILSLVLVIMFQGVRWVLAPIGLVLGSVVVTRATLALVGAKLSMVSSMLNSLLTVIGIATCMHVIVYYRDIRNEMAAANPELDRRQQILTSARRTLQEMAAPVFWTCVTTAIGFSSLLVSQITPIRSFSVMMSLGTGVVMVGCLFVLPATLGSGSRLTIPPRVPLEHWLDRALQMTCRAVEQRPVMTGFICFAMFAAAIPGVLKLTLETDFSKNFKESSSIVKSLQFVEQRLGGAGSWEISFDTPPKLTDDFLEDIKRLTDQLREISDDDESMIVLSLTDISDLPPRIFGPAKTLGRIARKQPLLIENFYNEDAQRMRIVLRSMEQQPSENKLAQIAAIRECVRQFFSESQLPQQTRPEASGMFVLLAELIQSLLQDQLLSFIVASAGILICMTIAFRSLRIGIISLFPNVFPVAILMGILGWSGIRVNIGTAMITSVSMGLTVDSTIHYITAFERARKTCSVTEALKAAHAGAGRAVVFAYLALVAGFLVLTTARFIPLVYFGGLMSLSMIGGIFGDLVLLPLLLRWTTPVSSPEPDSEPGASKSLPGDETPDA